MDTQIESFDPFTAPEEDLTDCFNVRRAAIVFDNPEDPPPARDAVIGAMRVPTQELGICRYWVVRESARLVGVVQVALPPEQNSQTAMVEIMVHPDARRRGLAIGLLRACIPYILDSGRRYVVGAGLKAGGPGARWAVARGFEVTETRIMQVLTPPSVTADRWNVAGPTGYSLIRWVGSAPDERVASYAAARGSITDAPRGRTNFHDPEWNVTRVREEEKERLARGAEERVVAAFDDRTGEVVGLSILVIFPHKLEYGYQGDTVVVPAHRGHGLGRWMKSAMMLWLRDDQRHLTRVYTTTDSQNTHMINVNEAVGYRTIRAMIWVEDDVSLLKHRLEGVGLPTKQRN